MLGWKNKLGNLIPLSEYIRRDFSVAQCPDVYLCCAGDTIYHCQVSGLVGSMCVRVLVRFLVHK